jgi:outer membrane protein assembly factor BamB
LPRLSFQDFVFRPPPRPAGPEQWVARYDGTGNIQEHDDEVASVAASPDGSKVFVTGTSASEWSGATDYATVAYDATTGTQLWIKRYTAALNGGNDVAVSVAVGRDGSSVFVTGSSDDGGYSYDYFTIAYDASTGTRLWAKRFGHSYDDVAYALVVSPDGSKVFVTGDSLLGPFAADADYATVAYDASTGTKLWVKRYDGPHHNYDVAVAASVSPDGSAVFVTGKSKGSLDFDYATVAY